MAIRVAILDDAASDRELMEQLVRTWFESGEREWSVKSFIKSEALLIELDKGTYYDLYFLDMEMPDRNGLQVAREIRKYYLEPVIVYVTDHVEYAPAAFEVNAYRYIPKVLLRQKLPEVLEAIVPVIEQQDESAYIFEYGDKCEKILYRNIYYIKKEGKYITIFHRGGEYRERKSLQAVYGELDAEIFFYLDKSYIVNVRNIYTCQKGMVLLRDGTQLPVSRPRFNEVREKIMHYWRDNTGCSYG